MILEIIMDHAALFHISQTHFSSNRVHSCLIHRHQPPRCPNLTHRCPERQKSQLGDLEELPAKWNSDDCDAADNTDCGIADCHRNPRHNQPDDVGNQAHRAPAIHHFPAKRKKCQPRKLEALQPDRYPDDGDAPQASRRQPRQTAQQSTADEPEYVSQYAHVSVLLLFLCCTNAPKPAHHRMISEVLHSE